MEFRNAAWVAAVCAYCGSNLVRRDAGVQSQGKVAALQEDGSVLQLGARGRLHNRLFMLAGRIQRGWERGYWSEWYADFGDGREGWLAEAMGFYYFTFRQNAVFDPRRLDELRPGESVRVAGHDWQVSDIKDCRIVSAAGELPEPAVAGFESRCVDLVAGDRRCATLERLSPTETRFYAGEFAEFDELRLTGLREIDGW